MTTYINLRSSEPRGDADHVPARICTDARSSAATEDKGVADLLRKGREPRRGVCLLDREETPMEIPSGTHPEPPVADPGEHPTQRGDVGPSEDPRETRRRLRHDSAERGERLSKRQVAADPEESVVAERHDAVRAGLQKPELGFRQLPADGALDRERDGGERHARIAEDPCDPADEAHSPAAKLTTETADDQGDIPVQQGRCDRLLLVR